MKKKKETKSSGELKVLSEAEGPKIKPYGDWILIEPINAKPQSADIFIPSHIRQRTSMGKVLDVGFGKRVEDGRILPHEVKKGQIVFFNKFVPHKVKDTDYYLVCYDDILAVGEED